MKLRSALLAATILAAPFAVTATALAQPVDGLYIAGGVGGNYRDDQDLRGIIVPSPTGGPLLAATPTSKIRTDWGFVGLGSIGYGLGNGLRIELEGNYRQNRIRQLNNSPFPSSAGGDAQTYGGMVNVLYDLDLGLDGVYPYLGAGAGYAWTELHNAHFYSLPTYYAKTNDTDGNFAAQGIVGLAIPVAALPGLSFTVEGRVFAQIGDTSFNGFIQTPGAVAGTVATTPSKFKLADSLNYSGLVGLRYAFNQPEPPPPAPTPQPVAAPARSYLVFFDWDKATLTERARQIIHEAADNSTHVQYTRIEVNGYTDTSGTPRYNQGLSVRRAQAVAAELVRDGVPRQSITIQGFGETHLLVPTGPGVREPQNRRVEIIIR